MPRTDGLQTRRGAAGAVAILADPSLERLPGHADPTRLRPLLEAAGFGVTPLLAGDVCDSQVLQKANVDVLVLPNAPFYPAEGKAALLAYLKQGGAFFSTGGYALDRPVLFGSAGWADRPPAVPADKMDKQPAAADYGLNTRYGGHGDTMQLGRDQIGVFDPSYLLQHVRSLRWGSGT